MSFRTITILTAAWTLLAFQLPGIAQEADRSSESSAKSLHEQAWRSHIEVLPSDTSVDEFQRTLDALRSVEFKPDRPPAPAETAPTEAAPDKPQSTTDQPTNDAGLSEEDLARLATVPAEDVQSPELVAEALFRSGRWALAGRFFEMAADAETDDPQRAWLMFMTANCVRTSGSDEAVALFEKVAADFPDTNWARLAQAQKKILEWQAVNNIAALLDSAATLEK